MIELENLSLTYPSKKGIFDLNFSVNQGEILGYLGPNGAGKTTTMRVLMGFMKASNGSAKIDNLDCFNKASEIHSEVGYLPGEVSFPDSYTGDDYLNLISGMRGITNHSKKNELLDMFEFSPKGKIKRYSKGMKQKLGIVAALMHDPKILLLDEPSSGLDPLMQNTFIELIKSEKANGKTVLLSSHIFEEVEKLADRIVIVKEGRIVKISDTWELKEQQTSSFVVVSDNTNEITNALRVAQFEVRQVDNISIEITTSLSKCDLLIKTLAKFKINSLSQNNQKLEDLFMQYYEKKEKN